MHITMPGRTFWIEAYGGRRYRQERVKSLRPIEVPRLAVAVYGGTQPERLARLMREADDGLFARFCWFWPDPVPFRLTCTAPRAAWAIEALNKLRMLELGPDNRPVMVPLAPDALPDMEAFGREMGERQDQASGLTRSAYGKARGTALRLSLVLEYLWWCGRDGMDPPPAAISPPRLCRRCDVRRGLPDAHGRACLWRRGGDVG